MLDLEKHHVITFFSLSIILICVELYLPCPPIKPFNDGWVGVWGIGSSNSVSPLLSVCVGDSF